MIVLTVLRWVAGLFVFAAGMGGFFSGAVVGPLIVLLGALIVLPPTGRILSRLLPTSLRNEGMKLLTGVLSLLAAFALLMVGVVWSVFEAPKSDAPATASAPASTEPVASPPAPVLEQAPSLPVSPPAEITPAPAKTVDPNALMLIEGEGWDKTRRTWGPAGVARINKLMPLAAARAAASPECDALAIGGYSDDRSRPPSEIVFYFDCANKRRFYVSEAEIDDAQPAKSRNAQTAGISDYAATAACERSVRQQLNLPSTFDRDLLNSRVLRNAYGTLVVEFTFQAKNRMGVESNLRATCSVDDRGVEPAEITEQ